MRLRAEDQRSGIDAAGYTSNHPVRTQAPGDPRSRVGEALEGQQMSYTQDNQSLTVTESQGESHN
eukprot:1124422-Pyramimonas_sp.AAC.1